MTPLEDYKSLAEAIGVSKLYIKREDLHPYGSHKGRSIPYTIDKYVADGETSFAISSSGNAALAAALHIKKINESSKEPVKLDIFVGNHIAKNKLDKLQVFADDHIRVLTKERPLQALTLAVQEGVRSLRQSTDDTALIGYQSLAKEIGSTKNIGAIFIGTSSGTTAQALAQYFLENKLPIQVHIIQTSSCHPIAEAFDTFDFPDEKSLADAISDITAMRKSVLVPLIEKSGGRGWLAKNDDIQGAMELVEKHAGLNISTNSALSIVGAMQAVAMGYEINGDIVCMLGGD